MGRCERRPVHPVYVQLRVGWAVLEALAEKHRSETLKRRHEKHESILLFFCPARLHAVFTLRGRIGATMRQVRKHAEIPVLVFVSRTGITGEAPWSGWERGASQDSPTAAEPPSPFGA